MAEWISGSGLYSRALIGDVRAMRRRRLASLFILGSLVLGSGPAVAEPAKVALFEMVLVDSSLEGDLGGADPAEAARLELLDQELRRRLGKSERLEIIGAEEKSDHGCRTCTVTAAATLGADFALTGWVQKVSDLILNINLRVTAVESGRVVFQDSVDIRGNTDESWLRGLRHLVERRLLAAPG